ncbi:hypothetical protein A4U94_21525 [Prescottella equi]|nr:hypothetical protein A4U94_21525 [Prescottella equi]
MQSVDVGIVDYVPGIDDIRGSVEVVVEPADDKSRVGESYPAGGDTRHIARNCRENLVIEGKPRLELDVNGAHGIRPAVSMGVPDGVVIAGDQHAVQSFEHVRLASVVLSEQYCERVGIEGEAFDGTMAGKVQAE